MEGSDEEEGSLVSSASPLSEEGLEDAQMQQQDSESSSTSSDPPAPGGRRCRNKKASIVVLRIFLALLFIGITGLAVLLLVVTMYYLSGTLTGRTGWHGNVMASILIVYATFLLVFLLIVYCRHRFANSKKVTLEEDREEEEEITTSASDDDNNETNDVKLLPAMRVKKFLLFAILPLTILLLVFAEVHYVLVTPTTSIFPLRMIRVQDAIASSPEGGDMLPDGCDVAGQMEVMKDFFRNSTILDFDLIKVVVGGVPVHFNKNGI